MTTTSSARCAYGVRLTVLSLLSFDFESTIVVHVTQDADNNTILLLLAEVQKPIVDPYSGQYDNPDILAATLSMARMYCQRYKFMLEWSNVQGKTALHVAALRGNEGLVKVRYIHTITSRFLSPLQTLVVVIP